MRRGGLHPYQHEEKVTYCVNALLCSDLLNEGHDREFCHCCGSSLLIGGRYRAIRLLRPYGNTEKNIYEAIDTQTAQHVALKIINWHQSKMLPFLVREHHFLTRAGDPFPRLKQEDYFSWAPDAENDFYKVFVLVLPFMVGSNSEQWVEDHGPASEELAVDWIIQATRYLEKLSYLSYIHRDIKPSNFMIHEGHLKLIDFESIREMNQDYLTGIEEMTFDDEAQQYRRFTKFFSLGYTAPEQIRGLPLPQSDYYALGRTAMFWVSGVEATDLGNGLDSKTIDWKEVNPQISQTFIDFLNWLTDQDARQRPVKANIIRSFLETDYPRLLDNEVIGKSRNLKSLFKLASALALVVIVGLGFWYGLSLHFYSQGVEAFERTQYKKAKSKFETSLSINRWNSSTLYYLGLECYRREDYKCAEKNYKKSIQLSWNPAPAQYQMGVLSETLGEYQEARQYYLAAVKSPNPESFNRLARLEILFNDFSKAQSYIDQGLSYANDDDMKARLLAQQGRIFYEKQEWEKAENVLTMSSELENTAESTCLLPLVKEKLNYSPEIVNGFWYSCFYAPARYSEGDDFREVLLRKAIPSIFSEE